MLKNALSLLSLATLSLSLVACVAESDEFVDEEEGLAGETSEAIMIASPLSALPVNGGPGGNAYTPNPVLCPGGYVATGFNLRAGGLIDNVQMQCTRLNDDGSFGATSVTLAKGGTGGTPVSGSCPAGQALTGQLIGTTDYDGYAGTYVSRLGGYCSSVSQVLAGNTVTYHRIYTTGGDPLNSAKCPAGMAVIGFQGRAGQVTDQIGFICGTILMPHIASYPVNAVQGQPATIVSVNLNGSGSPAISVAPGSTVTLNAAFSITQDVTCPSCIEQVMVGLGPNTLGVGGQSPKGCIYSSTLDTTVVSGSGTASFTAPAAPGIYPIRFRTAQAYVCDLNWWTTGYTPSTAETIGFLNVF